MPDAEGICHFFHAQPVVKLGQSTVQLPYAVHSSDAASQPQRFRLQASPPFIPGAVNVHGLGMCPV